MKNPSLPELESLYNLINNGMYDGYSTKYLRVEAEGYQYGHERWKQLLRERESLLISIKLKIKDRIKDVLESINNDDE